MRCPSCGYPDSRVVESRVPLEGDAVRRRRECGSCTRRFTTFERAEKPALYVVKRDGSRQLFDRAKVVKSLETACRKRPVKAIDLESAVDRIERELGANGDAEIPSARVGSAALAELLNLDKVAYVRFASVYGQFETIEDFENSVLSARNAPPSPNAQPVLL